MPARKLRYAFPRRSVGTMRTPNTTYCPDNSLPWFPRSSVGTHTEAQYRHETHAGTGSAGLHSHAGAWERGEASLVPTVLRGNPYRGRGRVQARNTCRHGNSGMHSHAGAWERCGRPIQPTALIIPFPGSHGPPWEPIPKPSTDTKLMPAPEAPVCIPTPEHRNEADAQYNLLP